MDYTKSNMQQTKQIRITKPLHTPFIPYQLKCLKQNQKALFLSLHRSPEFMEDEREEQSPRSPFWIQSTTNVGRIHRYRRRISSLFFNSFVLIIFLLLFAVLSMVFIIPSLIDFPSHIFKPNSMKRSWDSINLLLVLIALVFGFLSRNINNDERLSSDSTFDRSESEFSAGAPIMYDLQDQSMTSVIGLRRQRTSSSYPDLRELSPPWDHRAGDPWRFSDDTHLNYYRVLESNQSYFRQRKRREYNSASAYRDQPPQPVTPEEGLYFPPPQPRSTPSLPLQPLPHSVKKKTMRVYHNVATEDGERSSGSRTSIILSPGTDLSEQKGGSSERRRANGEKRRARSSEPIRILSPIKDASPERSSPPPVSLSTEWKRNGGNATKDFFTSFYHKKKKKRQRDRSVDNLSALLGHSQPPVVKLQSLPPSPPPPPPLPPSVLHNSFPSKEENPKKFISLTLPPPSPPPPPLPSPPQNGKCGPRPIITRVAPFVTDKPKVPLMITSFNGIDDSSSGGESPMKQIPPPPPLPPFKIPDWKFAVEGDFVRLQSTLSSRSVSPDGDEDEARSPSSDVDAAVTTGPPLFCRSPDVDTEADSFIARFRAGLKLERMSKLGPGPSPDQSDS